MALVNHNPRRNLANHARDPFLSRHSPLSTVAGMPSPRGGPGAECGDIAAVRLLWALAERHLDVSRLVHQFISPVGDGMPSKADSRALQPPQALNPSAHLWAVFMRRKSAWTIGGAFATTRWKRVRLLNAWSWEFSRRGLTNPTIYSCTIDQGIKHESAPIPARPAWPFVKQVELLCRRVCISGCGHWNEVLGRATDFLEESDFSILRQESMAIPTCSPKALSHSPCCCRCSHHHL